VVEEKMLLEKIRIKQRRWLEMERK
jgi:hypothetical protein